MTRAAVGLGDRYIQQGSNNWLLQSLNTPWNARFKERDQRTRTGVSLPDDRPS